MMQRAVHGVGLAAATVRDDHMMAAPFCERSTCVLPCEHNLLSGS
jgi:hypothetical protein